MHYDSVFHVDHEAASLRIAITNLRNFYAALPEETFVAVLLVNGPAIQLMVRDHADFSEDIKELKSLGVSIRVCRNALNHFNLTEEGICPECEVVPAGVVELIDLQRKGFAYIKP